MIETLLIYIHKRKILSFLTFYRKINFIKKYEDIKEMRNFIQLVVTKIEEGYPWEIIWDSSKMPQKAELQAKCWMNVP